MAIAVSDAAKAAQRYAQRASAAGQDYADGVRGAGQKWQTAAAASGTTYAAGVQEAIGRNAYALGVADAGASRYQERASTVGAQRFRTGVQDAGNDWQRGVAPYLDTIRSLDLPPRGPSGDPNNYRRVEIIGTALRNRKTGR
jgi:hypothetical protein